MTLADRIVLATFALGAAALQVFGSGDATQVLALALELAFVALAAAALRGPTTVPLAGALSVAVVVAGLTAMLLSQEDAAEPATEEVALAAAPAPTTTTTTATTATTAAPSAGDAFSHTHDVAVSTEPPTNAQLLRAADLVERTTAAIAPRFADTEAARAAGFIPLQGAEATFVHWVNLGWMGNPTILDPNEPESLVYRNTPDGQVLEAAMYILPSKDAPIPDVGGSLTTWHNHGDLCFRTTDARIVGTTASGPCPAGSVNVPTADMLHVWIVDHPGGPFAGIE